MELVHAVYERAIPVGPYPNGGFGDERDVFHVSFDPDAESVVEVVVQAASVIHNKDPEELEPIAETIDPDALEDLFRTPYDDSSGVVEVSFVYEGLETVVHGDGDIWLNWE